VLEAIQRSCSSLNTTEPFQFTPDPQVIQLHAN
jgi:hypothetical protein